MKPSSLPRCFAALLAWLLVTPLPAQVVTFTNHLTLGPRDTNYDGLSLVITNCTVTVDGPHRFASLIVQAGGVLTHTYAPAGVLEPRLPVLGETHTLAGTDPVPLDQPGAIPASLVVRDEAGLVTYASGADYLVGTDTNSLTTLARTAGSAIPEGATVRVDYEVQLAPVPTGLSLDIAGDLTVETGGAINASGRGYGPATGPGKGFSAGSPLSGSGGGHGGFGGTNSGNAIAGAAYGGTEVPTDKGSGGGAGFAGPGGSGGGAMKLTVGGALRVDGLIAADGASATNSRSGGGAGGSVWLLPQALLGTGTISAHGGAGEPVHGGGGGGGHISVLCATNAFTGSVLARGGPGAQRGGAGTVFLMASGSDRTVLVDNGGLAGAATRLQVTLEPRVIAAGGAVLQPASEQTLGSLLITSNAWLVAPAYPALLPALTVRGDATIERGGALRADGAGYPGGLGTGFGRYYGGQPFVPAGGGAGYGGGGGTGGNPQATGGSTYGSAANPVDRGSGGGGNNPTAPGGSGGGAIRLTVNGELTVDGTLSANGLTPELGGAGGGSGGSVWLTVGKLSGTGTIAANGGAGDAPAGGGGSGGRIAMYVSTNAFAGELTARGGGGFSYGGPGTVYLRYPGSEPWLSLDNAGQTGPLAAMDETRLGQLRLGPGVRCYLPVSSLYLANRLLIESNAWLVASNPLTITVGQNATIAAGGGITADANGFLGGQGPSAGQYFSTGTSILGGGGGHGGLGGSGAAPNARGGSVSYDLLSGPVERGSGGGGASQTSAGSGGGVIRLTVTGSLALDGRISADGGSTLASGVGGGAGGSVWLTVGHFSGSGTVSANGGTADARYGGGGGGGRVAVLYEIKNFAGLLSARGGGGFQSGGAGTIYQKADSAQYGEVTFHNGGLSGPPTPFSFSTPVDLFLANGAEVLVTGSIYPRSLVIGSNASLLGTLSLTIPGDVTIHAGGVISADAAGFAAGQGPGTGRNYTLSSTNYAGGGAHGGFGGLGGHTQAFGGVPYDSYIAPTQSGSGGGTASGSTNGGAGGGLVRLSVNGALVVNGRISAAGQAAPGTGGGGAGGAVWISASSLSGSGAILANGGDGHPTLGGGGGGGRIALAITGSNTFTGALRAWGGGGVNRGGAGTIYTEANQAYRLVLLDNGGWAGTNTGLTLNGPADLVLRGGARWAPSVSQTVRDLAIENGAAVLISIATLTAARDATIQAGGSFNADRQGYAAGLGQGQGRTAGYGSTTSGGGGAYGGAGGNGTNFLALGGAPYGSFFQPDGLGSGGGGLAVGSIPIGGAGGGSARLSVTGTLRVDGTLSANGGDAIGQGGGGGAGGSLNVSASSLAGAGVISANGGAGDWPGGGGGSGGRVSVTLSSRGTNAFTGTLSAWGGTGGNPGGAGTVLLTEPFPATQGLVTKLIIDAGDFAGPGTRLTGFSGSYDLWLQRRGSAVLDGTYSLRNVMILSNSSLVVTSAQVTLSGDATVRQGGRIVADGTGFGAGQGTGAGSPYTAGLVYAGGGGHGGNGAAGGDPRATGGSATGSFVLPFLRGSGGAPAASGGAGGGALRLNLTTGTLLLEGSLTANGAAPTGSGGGGGAGGSLWISARTVTGAGVIAANGGPGDAPLGGGGGGGRIAIYCATNDFTGPITAYGGDGANRGGAGTILLQYPSQSGQLVLDNGGWPGADTPFASLGAQALTVLGGAQAVPSATANLVQTLRVGPGGRLTSASGQSVLALAVSGDAVIESGGSVTMNGRGYGQMSGPGAGESADGLGSGAGHGGAGGSVPGATGGATYGVAETPKLPGSGGGLGWGSASGGSDGGGAIRLSVGGTLTVAGTVAANGNDGWQDNAGGGSGGSVWLEAGALAGAGSITTDGGWGELWWGGGGGGGRVAIHARTNDFTGWLTAAGGDGAARGEAGSVFLGTDFAAPTVLAHSPTGLLLRAVASMDVEFDQVLAPGSIASADFALHAPVGAPPVTDFTAQLLTSRSVRVTFPAQNTPGDYELVVGPGLENVLGQPMAAAYRGAFTLGQPVLSGIVTNLAGAPLSGVTLQPSGGLPGVTTGSDGTFALPVLPSWSGTVTPALGSLVAVPAARSFTEVTAAQTGADFLLVESITPALALSRQGSAVFLTWLGVPGVTYQLHASTNLLQWEATDRTVVGTNGPMRFALLMGEEPQRFFRLLATP